MDSGLSSDDGAESSLSKSSHALKVTLVFDFDTLLHNVWMQLASTICMMLTHTRSWL
jgi:hypothetical protein